MLEWCEKCKMEINAELSKAFFMKDSRRDLISAYRLTEILESPRRQQLDIYQARFVQKTQESEQQELNQPGSQKNIASQFYATSWT